MRYLWKDTAGIRQRKQLKECAERSITNIGIVYEKQREDKAL